MKEIKETILMGVLGIALAVGLSAAANDVPPRELEIEGETTVRTLTIDPCEEPTSDPMVAFKCLMGDLKADQDEAAKALCYFKEEFEAATWQRLGYKCV